MKKDDDEEDKEKLTKKYKKMKNFSTYNLFSKKRKNLNNKKKMSEEIINCKIVIVGEGQVGKTSIMNSYLGEAFNEEHVMTVSPEHQNKTIMIDNKTIKITFWDTAGQEQFRAVTKMFYKGADIVILVYDVTKPESFDEIKNYWASEVKNNANSLKGKI